MSEIANGAQIDKNTAEKHSPKSTNFPITKKTYGTYRFGENGVCLVWNGIEGDKVKVRQTGEVDSYTLKAPLMENIYLNKTYIQVPRQAILPRNWEKIHTQPSIGDDIDASIYGTSVRAADWNRYIAAIYQDLLTNIASISNPGEIASESEAYTLIERCILTLNINEYIFSCGSLINAMGAKFWQLWRKRNWNFDDMFEAFYNTKIGYLSVTKLYTPNGQTETYLVTMPAAEAEYPEVGTKQRITLNEFLTKVRDGDIFTVTEVYSPTFNSMSYEEIAAAYQQQNLTKYFPNTTPIYGKPVDLARLWAYQLTCAEWFTNDKVDYIYNAELFRQYIRNLWYITLERFEPATNLEYFVYNGIKTEIDELSAHVFKYMGYSEAWETITDENVAAIYKYQCALFKYNRSLKYKDYFTGSRTRPLAIGDTTIPVTGNTVDVVDVTKSIQIQRFLNIVNRIPRDLASYAKGIMGVHMATDYNKPLFLANTTEAIYGSEVENTAEAQMKEKNSRTMTLKNGSGKYEFNFTLDRDSIIVGIYWFDIERAYTKGVHRSFMHVDRFDMYNPYLQYTGDQPIYREEINAAMQGTFAYKEAYSEFKEEVNDAFGGFITDLPGWAFTDADVQGTHEQGMFQNPEHISPDFIRSKPSELDRYYLSLTGHSLSNYFHFIIKTSSIISATRKMSYKPQILG